MSGWSTSWRRGSAELSGTGSSSGSSGPEAVRLHLSGGSRLLAVGSPVVLVGLGGYGVVRGGLSSPGAVVLLLGLVLAGLAAWELPWSSEVDGAGVRWRALARERRVPWDEVVAVERHRRRGSGALVVRTIEQGKLALSDVAERPAEWDHLRALVSQHAPGAAFPEPPPGHPFHR